MDILASGIKTLKSTSSHLASRAGELKSQLSKEFVKNEGESREAEAIPVTRDGPVLIQYIVQNGSSADCEGSVFMLPEEAASGVITLATIKAHFPVPGRFHFRFKSQTTNGAFGGFVWTDSILDDAVVPQFAGGISMKVLRLPGEDNRVSRGPGVSAPAFIPAVPLSRVKSPSRGSLGGMSPLDATLPEAPPLNLGMDEPTPTQEERPDLPSSDMRLDEWDSPSKAPPVSVTAEELAANVSPVKAAPQPPPPPAPVDLMEWDKQPEPSPAQPPVQAKVFDRDALVAQREEEVRKRVEQAQQDNTQRQAEEEAMKASKVQASNKLCLELDRWAKTPDGTGFKDIRSLLSTQHEVLWAECDWKPVALSELIQDGAIKKQYRKAIVVVHPDKMKSADPDKQVRADRIFQALNEAFKAYTANEK